MEKSQEWRMAWSSDGRQYYYNRDGKTCWTKPEITPSARRPRQMPARGGSGTFQSRPVLGGHGTSRVKEEYQDRLEQYKHQLANLTNANNMLSRSLRASRAECRQVKARQRKLIKLLHLVSAFAVQRRGKTNDTTRQQGDGQGDHPAAVWANGRISPRQALAELRAIAAESGVCDGSPPRQAKRR